MTDTPLATEHLSFAFQQLRRGLLAYLYQKLGNLTLADDCLQDVFVKVLASNQNNTHPNNIKAWMFTIARNTVADYYRARKPAMTVIDNLITDDTSDELTQQELSAYLPPLAQQLPSIYRDTLITSDFEAQTMKTVAEQTSLSVLTIKSRASRARQMLKQKLLDCCHVELSASKAVIDYRRHSSTKTVQCIDCD